MPNTRDFKGCKVIINDEDGKKTIGESRIVDYHKATLTIGVDSKIFDGKNYEHVSLLIFHGEELYDFQGTVRKSRNTGVVDITLYRGKEKEDRVARRYELNAHTVVSKIIIAKRPMDMPRPVEALVVNISSTGMLIRARPTAFNLGTTIEVSIDLNDSDTTLICKVVRRKNIDNDNAEFGCKVLFARKED